MFLNTQTDQHGFTGHSIMGSTNPALLSNSDLLARIKKADEDYHTHDRSEASNAEYDGWRKEADRRGLPYEDVGGPLAAHLTPVMHSRKHLSLDNMTETDELTAFLDKRNSLAGTFTAEAKVDGLKLVLTYENHRLVRGATRGNGYEGEDVTMNVSSIKGIPLTIPQPGLVEITGEAYMPRNVFLALEQEQIAAGERPLANPRNAAAGAVRGGNPQEVVRRGISFLAYDLHTPGQTPYRYGSDSLLAMSAWGFSFPPTELIPPSAMRGGITPGTEGWKQAVHTSVLGAVERLAKARSSLPFDIDGVVIKVNDLEARDALGHTARTPRWASAFKFPPEEAETVLTGVSFEVGPGGTITPVAQLAPVRCGGVVIARASLHNTDNIQKLKLRANAIVKVCRSGDTIPKVIGLADVQGERKTSPIVFPIYCPSCNSLTERDGAFLRCSAPRSGTFCKGSLIADVIRFASKDVMNIKGLGEARARLLVENQVINKSPLEVMSLTVEQITAAVDKPIQAGNLLMCIEYARETTIPRVIASFGIPGLSLESGNALADKYGTMSAILDAIASRASEIPQIIGQSRCDALFAWGTPETLTAIRDYTETKLRIEAQPVAASLPAETNSDTPASTHIIGLARGANVVLTGKLFQPRAAIASRLKKAGVTVQKDISKKTSALIAGDKPGSNLSLAQERGIPVLGSDDLSEWLSAAEAGRSVTVPATLPAEGGAEK